MRERGLKLLQKLLNDLHSDVVPRAGTWIETTVAFWRLAICTSFPVRERGLKPRFVDKTPYFVVSFPVRERGLKLQDKRHIGDRFLVVPRAGTWIET